MIVFPPPSLLAIIYTILAGDSPEENRTFPIKINKDIW